MKTQKELDQEARNASIYGLTKAEEAAERAVSPNGLTKSEERTKAFNDANTNK